MLNNGNHPKFTPRNPEKYLGDTSNIVIRSSWEAYAFSFCDNNPNILSWCSEEIVIPYMKPFFSHGQLAMKPANYYPDIYVEYINEKGEFLRELIEVKPEKQSRPSKARTQSTKFFENYTYIVNQAKWSAAMEWCKVRNIKFSVVTEKSLFGSGKK
jgi:hypothetical protein